MIIVRIKSWMRYYRVIVQGARLYREGEGMGRLQGTAEGHWSGREVKDVTEDERKDDQSDQYTLDKSVYDGIWNTIDHQHRDSALNDHTATHISPRSCDAGFSDGKSR